MPVQIFARFTRALTDLPVEAVIRALDLECKMLDDDLAHERLPSSEDAASILCFGQFVRMAKVDAAMRRVKPLPPDHVEPYKETIVRLVQADELPASAMQRFDHTFQSVF
jgi:hypothetical protein